MKRLQFIYMSKIAVLFLLVTAFNSSCNKGGSDVDLSPPEIVSQTPANESENIPITSLVTVSFDKSVAGIDDNSFYLQRPGSSIPVSGTLSYNDSTYTATFDPDSDLEHNSYYVAVLTDSVKSRSGVAIDPVSWVFTTNAVGDIQPPTVQLTAPSSSFYVDTSDDIVVQFSELMIGSTINNSSFVIMKQSDSSAVEGTIAYDEGRMTATFHPAEDLADWTDYYIELNDSITDLSGNPLSDVMAWPFRTDDTASPEIISSYPDWKSTETAVPVNPVIFVAFSEAVRADTVKAQSFYLMDSLDNLISCDLVYNPVTFTVSLMPAESLVASSTYTVHLSDNAHIKDISSLHEVDSETWSFTTSSAPADDQHPYVIDIDPQNNQTGVAISPSTVVTVTFSERVLNVTSASLYLKDSLGNLVSSTVVAVDPFTATLTPRNRLLEGTEYTVYVTDEIKDRSNLALNPAVFTFITTDETIPTIVSKTPADGVAGISVTSNVVVVFSENVISGTISDDSFMLDKVSGGSVSGTVSYDSATRTAVFNPSTTLSASTAYKVSLTNNIRDLIGNRLAPTTWQFTTGTVPDTTAPAITNPSPAGNRESINTTVSAQVSEQVVGVSESNVLLKKGTASGSQISAQVTYDPGNRMIYINPDEPLINNQLYTVVVIASATTGLKDLSGNPLASDYTWQFTTIPDEIDPTIMSRSPVPGVNEVPGNAVYIEAIFSEEMQGISSSSFRLRDPGNAIVPDLDVAYTYDPVTKVSRALMTRQSSNPITVQGSYTVEFTSAVKDMAGNGLSAQPTWSFGIIAIDIAKPYAASKEPVSPNVWRNRKVTVVFSEDVRNVNGTTLYVEAPGGNKLLADVSYSTGLQTATLVLDPSVVLTYDTQYTAYLEGGIADRAGNNFVAASWIFSTEHDGIPPEVTDKNPGNGSTGCTIDKDLIDIRATFSEEIQNYTGKVTLKKGLTTIPINAVSYNSSTHTISVAPLSDLDGDSEYTVIIDSSIEDTATPPNSMPTNYSWTFHTQIIPDETPPEVSSSFPAKTVEGATGISRTDDLWVKFTENVVNAEDGVTLRKNSTTGAVVPSTITYSAAEGYKATIDPSAVLDELTEYYIVVNGSVKDESNNLLYEDVNGVGHQYDIKFTTAADIIAPTFTSKYYKINTLLDVEGASGVTLSPTIMLYFSEAVTGVSATTVVLERVSVIGDANTPAAAVSLNKYVLYDDASASASVTVKETSSETSNGNLMGNTKYRITVSGISDLAVTPNTIVSRSFTFTTSALPYLQSCIIADGSTNVATSTTSIALTFNKTMDTSKSWVELNEVFGSTSYVVTPQVLTTRTWSDGTNPNNTLTLAVNGTLRPYTKYNLKLYGWGGTFQDTDGNQLSRANISGVITNGIVSFTTGADSTAATISSSIPPNGDGASNGIPYIVLRFGEPMDTSTPATVAISNGNASAAVSWQECGRTAVISSPSLTGAVGTTHTISLTSFRDLAGNYSTGTYSCSTIAALASSVLTENFESSPFTYFTNRSDDSSYLDGTTTMYCNWSRVSSGTVGNSTTVSPHGGTYMAKGSEWLWNYGNYADLEMPSGTTINLSGTGTKILSFWMNHTHEYLQNDRIEVYYGINGNSPTTLLTSGAIGGSLYRYDNSFVMTIKTGGTTTIGSNRITMANTSSTSNGMFVLSNAFSIGTTISSIILNSRLNMSSNATVDVANGSFLFFSGSTIPSSLTPPVWKQHFIDLSSINNGTVRLRIRAYSAGEAGANVYIDDLSVTRY